MTMTSPLDELGALANEYKDLLSEKARDHAKMAELVERQKKQKDALWPICLSDLKEAVANINDRLSGTGAKLKVTTDNSKALTKRDNWQDRVEVLLLGGVFVNDNLLVEVDKLGNICVSAIKEDKQIFLLATPLARFGVTECSREKWEEVLVPLVSRRIKSLMTY